jgi:hypothetical protein
MAVVNVKGKKLVSLPDHPHRIQNGSEKGGLVT